MARPSFILPLTFFNDNSSNSALYRWHFNRTDLDFAYMNKVLVFAKYLNLYLPCNPNYTKLNLREFIDNHNPMRIKYVRVILRSGCHHPTIETGDLTPYVVVFDNYGSVESGWPTAPGALIVDTPLVLNNYGYIRARGGRGGQGGKGHFHPDYSEERTHVTTMYSTGSPKYYWRTFCSGSPRHMVLYWNNKKVDWYRKPYTNSYLDDPRSADSSACTMVGPVKLFDGWGEYLHRTEYYRGNSHGGGCYDIIQHHHYTVNFIGGEGGDGGRGGEGQYYMHPAQPGGSGYAGKPGQHPPQTTGYTGGIGGWGGDWGETGEQGHPYTENSHNLEGAYGESPGRSIVHYDNLAIQSTFTGHIVGPICYL
jgi:hypothetical protein